MDATNQLLSIRLMSDFADRTRIESAGLSRRYLWTDAFAVCTFIALERRTRQRRHLRLARILVDRVHHELGRYRRDDSRHGWLSGASEVDGERHPTRGGLRIGKKLPERREEEAFDADLEWERDGQYFHYLTKWMHALDQLARFTGERRFNQWARELALAAYAAFVRTSGTGKQLAWKLSTDLSRRLVPSSGQHDPLDGFVTCRQLIASADALGCEPEAGLWDAAADFSRMIDIDRLATHDPLGLGGLLFDARRLARIDPRAPLVGAILVAAVRGLDAFEIEFERSRPAAQRLAYRELGLVIGLSAAQSMWAPHRMSRLDVHAQLALDRVMNRRGMREEILEFWMKAENHRNLAWSEHLDINQVMLATALMPDGFLTQGPEVRHGSGDVLTPGRHLTRH